MGEKNNQINAYLKDRERFADFFNVNLFCGRKVIRPEELAAGDTKTIHKKNVPKSRETSADIVKLWHVPTAYGGRKGEGILLSILCLETQNNIHYAMPIRSFCYEADRYEEQYKDIAGEHRRRKDLSGDEYLSGFSREDKVYPVISFVLYLGGAPWDGPRDLHSMISYDSYIPDIRLLIKKYSHNFSLNLLDINSLSDTETYQSELREVFGVLCRQNDKDKMKDYLEKNDKLKELSREGAKVVESYVGISDLNIEEEMTMDMCKAMREWSEEEQAKGREEGYDNVIYRMLRKNQTPEFISEMTEQPLEHIYELQKQLVVQEELQYGKEEN